MKTIEEMKARLGDIKDRLAAIKKEANPSEFVGEIDELTTEFESLSNEVRSAEALAKVDAIISRPNRKVENVSQPGRVEVVDRYAKTGGFKNLGDLAKATVNLSKGQVDNRFQNATAFEFIGEDGGVLVPSDFVGGITKKLGGDQSLLSRCRTYNVSGNHLSLNVDEKQPWNGGVQASWMEEGGQYSESKPSFGSANFRLHKLGAIVSVTDELLADAAALESHINSSAPEAILHKVNDAILNGDGAGKPKGILNSGFKISVAKESGQAADTVKYENIIKMESRLIPGSNAVWIANPAVKEQLRQMTFSSTPVYVNGGAFPNAAAQPFDTLLGRPVIYMLGATKALGDEGDIILADLDYYYAAVKGGIKSDMSTHLYFDRDLTALKFSMRIDGQCPFKSAVTTENGSYNMSGFITLAARA